MTPTPTPSAAASSPLTGAETQLAARLFNELFGELSAIGLDANGATTRLAWTAQAKAAAEWFTATARRLGLHPITDVNGNQWAFANTSATGSTSTGSTSTSPPPPPALVTGSHLDSVAQGGRYDGALGVVVGLVAVHLLIRRAGTSTAPPLAVVAFADEEGARFNTPTFGSRLLTGALDLDAELQRTDKSGVTLNDALVAAGLQPQRMGRDDASLARISSLIEVHIEQEHTLAGAEQPLALATQILPHGRWRFDLTGESGHAGTTPMHARHDPALTLAAAIGAARQAAFAKHGFATIGRIALTPNVTNCIPASAQFWLDARAPTSHALEQIVEAVLGACNASAQTEGIEVQHERESLTAAVEFDPQLRTQIAATLTRIGLRDTPMATGAGHDAGALAATHPTAMLFVRSTNGASHSPAEQASDQDCVTAIAALTAILDDLQHANASVSTATPRTTDSKQPQGA